MEIETILVESDDNPGWQHRINVEDFDKEVHREVKPKKSKSADDDKLPDDFPGIASLAKAKPPITKLSQLEGKTKADLMGISGIGDTTANAIMVEADALLNEE